MAVATSEAAVALAEEEAAVLTQMRQDAESAGQAESPDVDVLLQEDLTKAACQQVPGTQRIIRLSLR